MVFFFLKWFKDSFMKEDNQTFTFFENVVIAKIVNSLFVLLDIPTNVIEQWPLLSI